MIWSVITHCQINSQFLLDGSPGNVPPKEFKKDVLSTVFSYVSYYFFSIWGNFARHISVVILPDHCTERQSTIEDTHPTQTLQKVTILQNL